MGIQKRISLAVSGLLFAGVSALTFGAAAPAAMASTTTVSTQSVSLPSWGDRGRGHRRCFGRFERFERFDDCCFDDCFDDFDECDDFC